VTGHSQDFEHWRQHIKDWGLSTLEELNAPITRVELLRTAMALKRYKAPGEDGLTAEWLKQVLDPGLELAGPEDLEKDDWEASYPQSPMERVVLRLLNQVWETGYIPECWRRAQLVSILKKGDPLDMDNYRGISLMAVPLKLLLAVLARRLSDTLVASGRMAQEQGGFRVREECVGQAAASLEAGGRPSRWRQGELELALSYRFAPGAPDDGITVHVPLEELRDGMHAAARLLRCTDISNFSPPARPDATVFVAAALDVGRSTSTKASGRKPSCGSRRQSQAVPAAVAATITQAIASSRGSSCTGHDGSMHSRLGQSACAR
jgi:hypothetical protein